VKGVRVKSYKKGGLKGKDTWERPNWCTKETRKERREEGGGRRFNPSDIQEEGSKGPKLAYKEENSFPFIKFVHLQT